MRGKVKGLLHGFLELGVGVASKLSHWASSVTPAMIAATSATSRMRILLLMLLLLGVLTSSEFAVEVFLIVGGLVLLLLLGRLFLSVDSGLSLDLVMSFWFVSKLSSGIRRS